MVSSGNTYILETERLYLREFQPADALYLYLLNADPEVLKYTGDLPFKSVREAKELILNYEQYRLYKVGRWSVLEKSSGAFLGWCGLKFSPEHAEYDLVHRFFKQYWKNG